MKTFFLLVSALASAAAFNAPMLATRAVGKTTPKAKASTPAATKAVKAAPAKKAFALPSFGAKPKPTPVATKAVSSKKSSAKKVVKAAPTKKVVKAAPTKKVVKAAPTKKVVKAAPTKKVFAKKVFAKKAAPTKKVVAKKAAPKKKVVAKKAIPVRKIVAKKAVPTKKVAAKKVKSSAAQSQGYPSFDFTTFKPFSKISGGGNRAPTFKALDIPNFADPSLQIKRDPAFYAAAAATRKENLYGSDFVYDDGLTLIERKQQKISPAALSGSAKDTSDPSAVDTSVQPIDFFGLGTDRFQLLFIAVFGLFTLVGALSGRLQL